MTTAKKLLTADDLLAMPDDGKKYELVRGELIEMPPPGYMHGVVVGRIGRRIGNFVEEHNLDFIETFEVGIYTEQAPDTVRAPDYTLTSLARIIAPLPQRGYVFGLIPDLVVEVISPGYSATAAEARARDVAGRRRAAGSGGVHCHGGDSRPFRRWLGTAFRRRRYVDLRAGTAGICLPGGRYFRPTSGNGGARRIRIRGLWDSAADGGRFVVESAHSVGQRG